MPATSGPALGGESRDITGLVPTTPGRMALPGSSALGSVPLVSESSCSLCCWRVCRLLCPTVPYCDTQASRLDRRLQLQGPEHHVTYFQTVVACCVCCCCVPKFQHGGRPFSGSREKLGGWESQGRHVYVRSMDDYLQQAGCSSDASLEEASENAGTAGRRGREDEQVGCCPAQTHRVLTNFPLLEGCRENLWEACGTAEAVEQRTHR